MQEYVKYVLGLGAGVLAGVGFFTLMEMLLFTLGMTIGFNDVYIFGAFIVGIIIGTLFKPRVERR